MGKKIKKISKIISEEGIFFFFLKIFKYINTNICGITKEIIFEQDLEKPIPKITTELELSFRMASKEDINLMDEEHYDYDLKGKHYSKDRLAKGDRCILSLDNNRIIGYTWIMKDYMELSQFNHILLSKNRIYVYKAFILKEYRGKRIQMLVHKYLANMLRKEGKRFVVLFINIKNKSSIKCVKRVGFKRIGFKKQFTFFGLRHDYIKNKNLLYLQGP
jgi:RimJ/RimL family protein N-acetyltransferase